VRARSRTGIGSGAPEDLRQARRPPQPFVSLEAGLRRAPMSRARLRQTSSGRFLRAFWGTGRHLPERLARRDELLKTCPARSGMRWGASSDRTSPLASPSNSPSLTGVSGGGRDLPDGVKPPISLAGAHPRAAEPRAAASLLRGSGRAGRPARRRAPRTRVVQGPPGSRGACAGGPAPSSGRWCRT
jgi:hypothetical protein